MTINSTHSDYDICYKRWRMAFDFYRGGRYVLEPDWDASMHHWIVQRNESEESVSEDARNASAYEWVPSSAQSYLWKHPSERREEYEERHARAVHYPHFSQYVEIFVSGIFKSGQSRENVTAPFADYVADVDLIGNNIDIFMRHMLAYGIVFGRCHAITDMPSYDGSLMSLADQRNRGIRAYSKIITPLSLIDWDCDEYNNFNWVKIKEPAPQPRSYSDNQPDIKYQYRVLTKDSWHVYEADERGNAYLADEGVYPESLRGTVPIATIWTAKERAMACESPIASIIDGDRHLFNQMSEADTIRRLNGFSMLCVPNLEGMPVGPIDIGPGRALSYPAQAGSPQWLGSDPNILSVIFDGIDKESHSLRVLAGVSRGAAEGSKELRSAAALSEEAENRRNQMAVWSASAQDCERKLLEHVAGWEGYSRDRIPSVSYQMNFNQRAVSIQINDLNQLNSTMAINDEVRKEIAKPIVYRVLKENGVDESEILRILKLMDRVEAPAVVPGVAGDSEQTDEQPTNRDSKKTKYIVNIKQ